MVEAVAGGMTTDQVRSLVPGEEVVMLDANMGVDAQDVERTWPAGTSGRVLGLRTLPNPQGLAVTITVGPTEDESIVAVFDESDESGFAFRRATDRDPSFTGEPLMTSAGAELMALSFRLENHPEFSEDAKRLREISGWATIGKPSDFERGAMNVMGSMIAAMRRRNHVFSEDLPISTQFCELLDDLPDPLPGESRYVDQATLDPVKRRDVFDATVTIGESRRWSGSDGMPRAVAQECLIETTGVHGRCLVHAEGFLCDLLESDTVVSLKLRSSGGGLQVVGIADERKVITGRPLAEYSRQAATILKTLPYDQETAALVAKGLDDVLADDDVTSRYEPNAVAAATAIRDALDLVTR